MPLIQLSTSNGDSLLINSGSFSTGKIIRTRNELVFYTDQYGNSTGYRWLGNLPHTINGNSPQTDGGISSVAWESYITENLYDKLKTENITLTGTAHLPTVEVAYGLRKGSLKVWVAGSTSTSHDYWLYSDGTVWGGVGTLGTSPNSPFTQIHLQRDIIKYSYVVQNNGETIVTVPYDFSSIVVYVNGVLQSDTFNSYSINNRDVIFSSVLNKGDNIQFFFDNVPISSVDYALKSDLSLYCTLEELSSVNGGALIGLENGGTVQDAINYITPEMFGAVGDGITDDTNSWKLAILESQNKNILLKATAGNTYLITDTLDLVLTPTSTTYKSAMVYGDSDVKCKLKFVGSNTTIPAIRAKGNTGISGSNSAYGVVFSGFYIDCTNWSGDGILWENIALWSLLEDVQVWLPDGIGIYAKGYTDHVWRNVEVRGAGSYGIFSYEPSINVDGYFHEVSYMRFENVKAFASNNYGVQWRFEGGNGCIFDHCKPSEGTVGLDFYKSIGHTLIQTYADGTTKVNGSENIAIRINTSDCINYNIIGGRFVNIKYALDIVNGGYINTGPWSLSYSQYGGDVYDVRIGSSVTLPINIPTASRIIDNTSGWVRNGYNSYQTSYSTSFASSTTGNGTITSTFRDNGKFVNLEVLLEIGTTTVLPTTYVTFTLPSNRYASTSSPPLEVSFIDSSAGRIYVGKAVISPNGVAATIYFPTTDAGGWPVVPAAGDKIFIYGQYHRQ